MERDYLLKIKLGVDVIIVVIMLWLISYSFVVKHINTKLDTILYKQDVIIELLKEIDNGNITN